MFANPHAAVLNQFGWLADLYTVDFFVERHWDKLPKAWRVYFDRCLEHCKSNILSNQPFQMEIQLIQHILSGNPQSNGPFSRSAGPAPLSYLALKQCVKSLSLSYRGVEDKTHLCNLLGIHENILGGNTNFTNLLDQPAKLRSKLKPKKLHEVGRLCDLLDILLAHHKVRYGEEIKQVVDIGAGIGHLSRIFSLTKNLDVITVEGNSEFVEKSRKIDQVFMAKVAGKEWKAPSRQEAYIKHTLHIDSLSKDVHHQAAHVVVGLHSCGDLSATILRYFVHNSSARVLISVGCCYHKLNGGADKPFMDIYDEVEQPSYISGYPMSRKFKDVPLSYASREIASFSKDGFVENLREDETSKVLSIHIYRASLEHLMLGCPNVSQIHQLNPQLRHRGLARVKNATRMEFAEYVKEALKYNAPLLEEMNHKDQQNLSEVYSLLEKEGTKVVVMIALRLILAPLIEAIVVEDRKEFLRENKLRCYAVPLFEPSVSPRNIVLISFK